MATPRRRSARLSRTSSTPDRQGLRKTLPPHLQLGSLIERDETPVGGPQSTLDTILSSPMPAEAANEKQLKELSGIKTPNTLPRPAHAEMHPKELHQTTTKAPDSGLRFGFADIKAKESRNPIAAAQKTPSKTASRASLPQHLTADSFNFKFASESNLSDEARKLMNHVREDAERIKLHILAEKKTQERKDSETERLFGGVDATGRRIAKPQGKAGRFSDVHMAQFKKMDSIANHPSSFRAKPNFAQPTQQSLKRSGSKAGLDDVDRPRTAGKGTPGRPPPFGRTHTSSNSGKPLPKFPADSSRLENDAPAKRRKSIFGDISGRAEEDVNTAWRPSTLPRPKSALPTSLLTPTKSSLARSHTDKISLPSPSKISLLPRSNSVKSLKIAGEQMPSSEDDVPTISPPKQIGLVRSESRKSIRPLPPIPTKPATTLQTPSGSVSPSKPLPALPYFPPSPTKSSLTSRLPTFQGLKSILRSPRRPQGKPIAPPTEAKSAGGTPKRSNTTAPSESGSTKKVDFTPSTKSRYAVKLAATSPSPSKLPHPYSSQTTSDPAMPYDPAAYTFQSSSNDDDENWEDAESEVEYPVLPSAVDSDPATKTPHLAITRAITTQTPSFTEQAQAHNRRESKEFKSIFTTLDHPSRRSTPTHPATLTDVNTKLNVKGVGAGAGAGAMPQYQHRPQPAHDGLVTRSPGSTYAAAKQSPSTTTIRRVRGSGVSELVKPFEDTIQTVPHGLPGKKRRREAEVWEGRREREREREIKRERERKKGGDDNNVRTGDGKENSRTPVPGAWGDDANANANADMDMERDEGVKRGGKRARYLGRDEGVMDGVQSQSVAAAAAKKPNKAREAAARTAREKKSRVPGLRKGGAAPATGAAGGGGGGGGVGAGARAILSMARLNMLSRPKGRR